MPENKGRQPPFERVDVIFRNGIVKRNIDPSKWRWKSWGWEADFDIVRYQRSLEHHEKK
jgi:hypothetical protein